jgi:hypothetical protein
MALSKWEQETVIRCSAEDKAWDIVTADGRVKTRLKRAGYEGKPDHQLSAPYEKFEVPFKLVRFGSQKSAQAARERAIKSGRKPQRPGRISAQNETTSVAKAPGAGNT